MKITLYKKIFVLVLFLLLNFILVNKIFAATLTLSPSKDSLGVGEQFYVDLMLDPKGESINTIKGSITFPNDYVSLVRIEDGKSLVNLWVEKPKLDLDKNTISFAGVILNGFSGTIDPFNPNYKMPGLIIRLVFEAQKIGQVNFSTLPFYLNLNDGLGTEIKSMPVFKSINIDDFVYNFKYQSKIGENPELEAYITRNPDFFNNKHVLIFKATDKDAGIKSVMIKEGRRNWKEIESPYKLLDQSRHSDITLQAISYSGTSIIMKIDRIPYSRGYIILRMVIFILVIILVVWVIKKIYANKK